MKIKYCEISFFVKIQSKNVPRNPTLANTDWFILCEGGIFDTISRQITSEASIYLTAKPYQDCSLLYIVFILRIYPTSFSCVKNRDCLQYKFCINVMANVWIFLQVLFLEISEKCRNYKVLSKYEKTIL